MTALAHLVHISHRVRAPSPAVGRRPARRAGLRARRAQASWTPHLEAAVRRDCGGQHPRRWPPPSGSSPSQRGTARSSKSRSLFRSEGRATRRASRFSERSLVGGRPTARSREPEELLSRGAQRLRPRRLPSAVSAPRAGPRRGWRGHGAPMSPAANAALLQRAHDRKQSLGFAARERLAELVSEIDVRCDAGGLSRSSRAIRRAISTRRARSAAGSSRTAAHTSSSCWRAASSSRRWRPMLPVSAFAAAISASTPWTGRGSL